MKKIFAVVVMLFIGVLPAMAEQFEQAPSGVYACELVRGGWIECIVPQYWWQHNKTLEEQMDDIRESWNRDDSKTDEYTALPKNDYVPVERTPEEIEYIQNSTAQYEAYCQTLPLGCEDYSNFGALVYNVTHTSN